MGRLRLNILQFTEHRNKHEAMLTALEGKSTPADTRRLYVLELYMAVAELTELQWERFKNATTQQERTLTMQHAAR